ncbi:hypothetical protein CA601_19865 [Paraburkholderia hospita]|nr:hypothetical protein CA602_29015 [Paraburkholderia hospita]OUL88012.1 hypothetical protein CA601_19865 [Paraburkholderia hospita]
MAAVVVLAQSRMAGEGRRALPLGDVQSARSPGLVDHRQLRNPYQPIRTWPSQQDGSVHSFIGLSVGNEWNGQGDMPDRLRAAKHAGVNPDFFRIEPLRPGATRSAGADSVAAQKPGRCRDAMTSVPAASPVLPLITAREIGCSLL